MRNVAILFGMLACLFGPTVVFTWVGRRSMESLGKRPTNSARVMVALITKLLLTAMVLIGLLVLLLKTFAK